MRRPDTRKTHTSMDRSPVRDSLAFYAHELAGSDMDADRRAHLTARLRRMMRRFLDPTTRDFALAAEKLYAVSIDPAVPPNERRKALASWLSAMKELGLVAKRTRGASADPLPQRNRPSPFAAPAETAPRRARRSPFEAPAPEPDDSGHEAETDARGGEEGGHGAERGGDDEREA